MKFNTSKIAIALGSLVSKSFKSEYHRLCPIGYEDGTGFHYGKQVRPNWPGRGTSSEEFSRFDLRLYQTPVHDTYVKRTLSFSNVIAEEVTIPCWDGATGVATFVFVLAGIVPPTSASPPPRC
jgi:hypothetical protein